MRLTFLGTGTSFGVPQIGCDCPVCRSTDPRDKRTRSGAVLEEGGATILIDTPPELRLQLIAGGFSSIDAVVYAAMAVGNRIEFLHHRQFGHVASRVQPIERRPTMLDRKRERFAVRVIIKEQNQ